MGIASYLMANNAHKRIGDLEEWVNYNRDYIYYLHDRIDELEEEIAKLKQRKK